MEEHDGTAGPRFEEIEEHVVVGKSRVAAVAETTVQTASESAESKVTNRRTRGTNEGRREYK